MHTNLNGTVASTGRTTTEVHAVARRRRRSGARVVRIEVRAVCIEVLLSVQA
jgi:hypothetical protein